MILKNKNKLPIVTPELASIIPNATKNNIPALAAGIALCSATKSFPTKLVIEAI